MTGTCHREGRMNPRFLSLLEMIVKIYEKNAHVTEQEVIRAANAFNRTQSEDWWAIRYDRSSRHYESEGVMGVMEDLRRMHMMGYIYIDTNETAPTPIAPTHKGVRIYEMKHGKGSFKSPYRN